MFCKISAHLLKRVTSRYSEQPHKHIHTRKESQPCLNIKVDSSSESSLCLKRSCTFIVKFLLDIQVAHQHNRISQSANTYHRANVAHRISLTVDSSVLQFSFGPNSIIWRNPTNVQPTCSTPPCWIGYHVLNAYRIG